MIGVTAETLGLFLQDTAEDWAVSSWGSHLRFGCQGSPCSGGMPAHREAMDRWMDGRPVRERPGVQAGPRHPLALLMVVNEGRKWWWAWGVG